MRDHEECNDPLMSGPDFDNPETDFQAGQTMWERFRQVGSNALKATVVAAELLPANEAIRYGTFAYAQTYSNNPVLGAAVLGGSTFVVEGAAAWAASDWVAQDKVKDFADRMHDKLQGTKFAFLSPKRIIPENIRITPTAEAGIAMTFGSVAVLEAKQRENPERTADQNKRYGLFTAGWMGGVFAAEGGLLSAGIDNYHNPVTVCTSLLGLAAIGAAVRKVRKSITKQETAEEGEE